jgi:hypothetical protein
MARYNVGYSTCERAAAAAAADLPPPELALLAASDRPAHA